MIRSEKQYQTTKSQLALLRESVTRGTQSKAPEALLRATHGQTAELADELEREIKDHEELR